MKKSESKNKQKVTILTLGCSKNLVDSEELTGLLETNGIEVVNDINKSNALIINTCGFIKAAKEENIQLILESAAQKKHYNLDKIIVAGCLSERYKNDLEQQIEGIDHFFGLNAYHDILRALRPELKHELAGERKLLTPSHYCFIKISEGCNHECSFCAIPLIRGKHNSKEIDVIINDVKRLVSNGVKEFNIIAQDTTYYGLDLYNSRRIVELIDKLSNIDGVKWIRLLYLYPNNFPMDLLTLMNERENICKYIDMPLQHISTRILKSMKRGGTQESITKLLDHIRNKVPNVALRSTFIVGYPGETITDFRKLRNFIEEIRFDRLGVFTYSHEEGTSAYSLKDSIPSDEKQSRYNTIMELQQQISKEINISKIGTTQKVIIDIKSNEKYYGRTQHDAPDVDNAVIIKSRKPLKPGDFIDVIIDKASEYDIYGNY